MNGNSKDQYTPDVLMGFEKLEGLTLFMPCARTVEVLPGWISRTRESLNMLKIHALVRISLMYSNCC